MIVILVIFILGVLMVIPAYNSLVFLKNQAQNGWKQIDVQLKRRHDLIPNLVETVKGMMRFEQETLTKVIEARNKAATAQGVAEKAQQENMLTGALRQFFALMENYPQLKSSENVTKLQAELADTENRISLARQFYNDIATKYNIAIQSFPTNLIARMFHFSEVSLFEVADAKEKELPRVDLNLK